MFGLLQSDLSVMPVLVQHHEVYRRCCLSMSLQLGPPSHPNLLKNLFPQVLCGPALVKHAAIVDVSITCYHEGIRQIVPQETQPHVLRHKGQVSCVTLNRD